MNEFILGYMICIFDKMELCGGIEIYEMICMKNWKIGKKRFIKYRKRYIICI